MLFSTMTMAPSTMMPKSSAPRLIKLALTLLLTMPVNVNSMDKGITIAVISAARKLPSSKNSTATTSAAPSIRLVATVRMVLSTKMVRLYTAVATTPCGKLRLISSSFLADALETVRLFSPININTVPSTTSSPFCVAAPLRNSLPINTSATSLMRTGTPGRLPSTISPISSRLLTCPGSRTRYCSPLFSI